MGAVAKRLSRGSAASTKRHSFFNRIGISVGILQFDGPLNDVGAILDDLNCYFSHTASLSGKSRIIQVQEPKARRVGAIPRDEPYEFNNKCPTRCQT